MRLVDFDRLVVTVEGYLHSIGFDPTPVRVEVLVELLAYYPARLTPQELSLQLSSDEFSEAEVAVAYNDLYGAEALRFEREFVRPGDDLLCFRASILDRRG